MLEYDYDYGDADYTEAHSAPQTPTVAEETVARTEVITAWRPCMRPRRRSPCGPRATNGAFPSQPPPRGHRARSAVVPLLPLTQPPASLLTLYLCFPFRLPPLARRTFQKKKSHFQKKTRTVATNPKEKPPKFPPPKSDRFASKKKKSYRAAATARLGAQVAKPKRSRSVLEQQDDL